MMLLNADRMFHSQFLTKINVFFLLTHGYYFMVSPGTVILLFIIFFQITFVELLLCAKQGTKSW